MAWGKKCRLFPTELNFELPKHIKASEHKHITAILLFCNL